MTRNSTRLAATAGIAATSMLAGFLVTRSLAQDTVQPPQQPGGFQTQPMQMGGFPPMMQGGGAAMVADSGYIFVLQGNRIFKVKESDLSVAAEKQLPRGPGGMMPPAGGPGQPGGGGGFGGGGGGLK